LYPQDFSDDSHELDIVFIHGVTGHPLNTWESLILSNNKRETLYDWTPNLSGDPVMKTNKPAPQPQEIIWPRDWLPLDIPNARILSVGYDLFLSSWAGSALPLEQQSLDILKKLSLAAVGNKPIIFVVHSFGGLITKEMLSFASSNENFKDILENTRGVVFFSTPHKGARIAKYADSLDTFGFSTVLRKNTVVDELKPSSEQLTRLNSKFVEIAPHVSTLSFGENDKTCIGSEYTCFQVRI
jgi:hypothetical protein